MSCHFKKDWFCIEIKDSKQKLEEGESTVSNDNFFTKSTNQRKNLVSQEGTKLPKIDPHERFGPANIRESTCQRTKVRV